MYGYGYRYNSGLVIGAGGGAPFANTYSLSLDGVDDYVDTNSTKFSGASEFSISMWANFSAFSGNNPIVSNWFSGVTNYIIRYSSTKLQFYISTTGGVAKVTEYTFTPTLGIWYNIICVYNGSNISIYINGTQQGTPTAITGTVLVNTNNCLIGERGTEHFNGLVDEVSYFDRFLTPTEITDISTTPTDLTSLNPISWYRNGDNGSWKSPQWLIPNNENKDKVSNYSLDFDAVDDYISVSDNSIGKTQNISHSIWVNLDVTSRQYIVGNQTSSNGGCGLAIEGGDVLVFQMGDGGNDSYFNSRVANFSTYAPINTWNHILATWDGTDSKIYINGVLRNTWSPTLPYTIIGYDINFNIGWRRAGFSFMTNGRLDELALFNSGISIGDVWDGSGQPIDVSAVSGITNYWKLGDNSTFLTNWTVPDAVGTNDGTSANMTIEDRVGDAPNSTNNAVSLNMDFVDVVPDVPN